MRLFLALSALTLSSCATLPKTAPTIDEGAIIAQEVAALPAADRAEVAPAVALEVGIRFRCPHGPLELGLLNLARTGFDTLLRPRILPESADLVDRLRRSANEACGIL